MAQSKVIRHIYTTTAFRVSYPDLFVPKAQMGDTNKMRYTLNMLFPKKAIVEALQNSGHRVSKYLATDELKGFKIAMAKNARANFGPEVNLAALKITKFRDGDLAKESGRIDENEKGYIVVRTSSKDKPRCYGPDMVEIIDPTEIYAGCWARAALTISPFFKPQHGVTIYLNHVQKIADDAAFSSRPRAEDAFDAINFDDVATDETDPLGI
ncbi:MAG: DUF2815 family protein [Candidatus Gracilibacteria bacterium]|nr:DUF2815 family protein [Candidatus Gracilibacteria bacterium]